MNWADKALIGITIVALLAVVVPISIGLAGEDEELDITGLLLQSAYGQTGTDFSATSNETSATFEPFPNIVAVPPTSPTAEVAPLELPPPGYVAPPPPTYSAIPINSSPFENVYEFPPQPIEITTPITGLQDLPNDVVDSFTYEKFQDGYTWEIDEEGFLFKVWDADRLGTNPEPKLEYPYISESYNIIDNGDDTFTYSTHSPYISDGYEWKPYILGDDDLITQVQTNGGTVVFDKVAGAVTIFNKYEKVVESDSYTIRTALIDTDVWSSLDVNDSPVETVIEEDGDKITVSFIRENDEGKYTTEYAVHAGKVKTTVYFTNYIYDNNKFAFTQTLDLPDNIISVNGMDDIDLNNYVGVSFDRATLEENIELVLDIKSIHYSSGLGFDNLWSVNVVTPTKVSLDYANVEEVQTAIGETVELDPTYTLNSSMTMSPGASTSSYGNSQGDSLGCGGRISSYGQGMSQTWDMRNYVGGWYTWNGCRVATVGFDLSSIPDTAIIMDTKLKYDIAGSSNAPTLDFNQMTQRGPDGWGLWGAGTGGNTVTGSNPYDAYCTTGCGAPGPYHKNWTIYLDANNLGTQPNGAGSQYAYNVSSAVGDDIITDLGAAGNADVMAQLNASTSVDGVADWFGVGLPYSTMKIGATAANNWTSQTVQTAGAAKDMFFENVSLQVTYYSPPSVPTNLVLTPNGASVDLTWSASEKYSNYIISSNAKEYPNNIRNPNTNSNNLFQGNITPTTPTMGVDGLIGNAMEFNGSSDVIGHDFLGYEGAGANITESSISFWAKPQASPSPNAPIGAPAFDVYFLMGGQWGYPNNIANFGELYTYTDTLTYNEWQHIVLTIDSTGSNNIMHVYIDGVDTDLYSWACAYQLNYAGCTPTDITSKDAWMPLNGQSIGSFKHSSGQLKYPFDGKIDEFSTWNKVLTQGDVDVLYNDGAGATPNHPHISHRSDNLITYLHLDNTSFPIENMAKSTEPSNDTVSYYFKKDGVNIASTTLTSMTDTSVSFNTPYVYSLQAYNNAGGGSKWNESPYEVSSDAKLMDGTNNGATTGAGGIIGNGWDFDGVNDYIVVPSMALNNADGHSWSIWANLLGGAGGPTYTAMEIIGKANAVNLLVSDPSTSGTTWASIYYAGSLSGTGYNTMGSGWHHFVGVTDCNGYTQWQCPVTIYMDGTAIGTGTSGMYGGQEYNIGARNGGSNGQSYYVSGLLDEFSAFDRALTSSEVTSLYGNGSPEPVNMQSWIAGSDLTHYYNFEQTGNTLTNMAVTEDPSSYAITLTVEPPTNLTATINVPNVDLAWTGGAGATGYRIDTTTGSATDLDVDSYNTSTEVGYVTSTNTITQDVATGWGNSKIQSTQTFTVGEPFSIDFSPLNSGSSGFIGLGQGTLEHNNMSLSDKQSDSLKFGMYIAGEMKVFEYPDNAYKHVQGSFNASDNYRIAVDANGAVTYYRQASGTGAFNLEYTSAKTASGTYYIQSNMYNQNAGFVDIKANSLWKTLVDNTGSATTTYQHTTPVQNTTNHYKVTTLIGSDESTANTGSSTITPVNYRTYTSTANASTCDTGTITADILHEIGMPSSTGGNRYCLVTSMEYDISAIPDVGTITSAVIEESHVIWTAGFAPSCDYKSNMFYQPSTSTTQEKWDSVIAGTIYANDPACIVGYTSNNVYDVPLSAQAVTDIESQLPGDWFGINWAIDNFPSLAGTGSVGTPASVYNGSSLLKLEYLAPASTTVGGAPDAPTGLTATFNNSTLDMDLSWTAPTNNNGSAVTGYKIEVSTDNSTWTTVISTTNTSTTYSHVSPTIGSLNYYKISSINSYGSGDTNVVYVTPFVDTTISLPASSWTAGVATDSSGNTYAALSSLNQIAVYNSSGVLQNTIGAGGAISCTNSAVNFGNPQGVAVDANGDIWVAEHSCHRVQKLDSSGNHLFYIGNTPTGAQGYTTAGFAYPYDVDFDTSGNVFVVDAGNEQISKFDSSGNFISQFLALPSSGQGNYEAIGLWGIAVDSDNDVYIVDRYNHRVSHYDSSGTYIDSLGVSSTTGGSTNALLNNPQGVAVDSDNNVYVADTNNKRIQKFDSSGTYVTSATSTSNNYNDLDVDPSYNIHVVSDERNAEIYGQIGTTINALAGGPPDAPTGLTVSYTEPNANLTWVAPTVTNGSAIIGYKVETSLDNSTWSPITVLTNTNVTYSHTNPTVGVDNYYRVSAINSIGTGVPGNVANVLVATIPTAPLSLTTTQTVPFVHDLSWSVPSDDGDTPVTNYKVYRDGSLITTLGTVTTYQDNTMQHTGHTHSYEVSAVNLIGESPKSNASSITSWNVPDATTGVTATARAGQQNELDWTAPANNGGSPITGYHIQSSTDNVTFTDVVASTTTQPYNHTGLTQGSTYYYKISAISAVGEGAFGTASATVGDVPDAPVSLTVVPQAGMQATITITIPNDNGYAISSYTLHRSSDNFATFTVLNSQTSNVIVDYPLNIGTSYKYKALATNSLGDSALSVASATALAGDVPSTPVAPGTVVATT